MVITLVTNKVTLLDADSRTVFFVTNNTYTDVATSKNKEFCWLYDEELACLRSRRIAVVDVLCVIIRKEMRL